MYHDNKASTAVKHHIPIFLFSFYFDFLGNKPSSHFEWVEFITAFTLYHRGTTISSPSEIYHSCSSSHNDHCPLGVAVAHKLNASILPSYEKNNVNESKKMKTGQTFAVELDSMDRMLMQIELTVIAGDHESYKISAKSYAEKLNLCVQDNQTKGFSLLGVWKDLKDQ